MLGIHEDAFRCREELIEFGVGYNAPMEILFVSSACKGNRDLAYFWVSQWCSSTTLELMRDPQVATKTVGVEFICTAALAYQYRNELPMPEPCTVLWASDLADRFLRDPRCKAPPERMVEVRRMHALARAQAQMIEYIPDPVLIRLKEAFDGIKIKYS